MTRGTKATEANVATSKEPANSDAARARRLINGVAILAEAFAAWNILAFYLTRFAASYTRPDLAGIAASARRRELMSAALVALFFYFAVYALSRSPRRVRLATGARYLRSALLATVGVIVLLAIEALALGLIFRGVHLQ